jgi:hypothetical protein
MDANWGYSMSNPMPLNGERVFFYSFLLPYRTVFTSCFFRINTAELKNSRLGKWIDVLRWYKWGMTLQLWAPSWQTLCPPKWPKMNICIYIIMMRKYIKMMDNHEVFWTTVDSWWALPDISSSVSAQHPPYSALSGPKIVFSSAGGVSRG